MIKSRFLLYILRKICDVIKKKTKKQMQARTEGESEAAGVKGAFSRYVQVESSWLDGL